MCNAADFKKIGPVAAQLVWAYGGAVIIERKELTEYIASVHPELEGSMALDKITLCLPAQANVCSRSFQDGDPSVLLLWDMSLSEEKARAHAQSFDCDLLPATRSPQTVGA